RRTGWRRWTGCGSGNHGTGWRQKHLPFTTASPPKRRKTIRIGACIPPAGVLAEAREAGASRALGCPAPFRVATGGRLADMRDETLGGMTAMTDAIELLRSDHDELRRLLSALETDSGGLGAQLVMATSGHEAIEEQYFWPLVRRRVQNGPRLADLAVSQEQDVKRLLDLLEKSGEDAVLLRQVITTTRAHIDFEETQVWPGAQLALSEQELGDLGAQLEQAKRLAPTRPHPHMPCTPEVLKVAAPIAGAADRIRDALGGRHRD